MTATAQRWNAYDCLRQTHQCEPLQVGWLNQRGAQGSASQLSDFQFVGRLFIEISAGHQSACTLQQKTGAQIFDHQDATVEVSSEDSDDFRKNLVNGPRRRVRAFVVQQQQQRHPDAYIKGSFAAQIGA